MTNQVKTAILHYSASPVIGGVEGVIQAHCQVLLQHGYPVSVIAGRGDQKSLPEGTIFHHVPELDSQHPEVLKISAALEDGHVPQNFDSFTQQITKKLSQILISYDNLIVHNVFTKHFNIPLSAAMNQLLDLEEIHNCIAWCHDFTWTSLNSRSKVHEGYPWDLLRKYDSRVTYVSVSKERQKTLANLYNQPDENIQVVYNGVDPQVLLGLSEEGYRLIQKLDILDSDLILLMPLRVTQAKNIEYALHLLKNLKERGTRTKLIHTGPPDPHSESSMAYYHSLQKLRRDLDLENDMHFIFESGKHPNTPNEISLDIVGELYRVSDVMLMPSHREGFGMPVLEAGLVGIPAICTFAVPAAVEIGGEDVTVFKVSDDYENLGSTLLEWTKTNPQYRFKRRIRQKFTWDAIFRQDILPLLSK